MQKLSAAMLDVIDGAMKTDTGYVLMVGNANTVKALKSRGLVTENGLALTPEGATLYEERNGYIPTDEDTRETCTDDDCYACSNPEKILSGDARTFVDNHVAELAPDEAPLAVWELYALGLLVDHPFESGILVTQNEQAELIAEDEATRAVVPNRKDRRAFDRVLRLLSKNQSKARDKRAKKFGSTCNHPLKRRTVPDLFKGFGSRKREVCTGCGRLVVMA